MDAILVCCWVIDHIWSSSSVVAGGGGEPDTKLARSSGTIIRSFNSSHPPPPPRNCWPNWISTTVHISLEKWSQLSKWSSFPCQWVLSFQDTPGGWSISVSAALTWGSVKLMHFYSWQPHSWLNFGCCRRIEQIRTIIQRIENRTKQLRRRWGWWWCSSKVTRLNWWVIEPDQKLTEQPPSFTTFLVDRSIV